MNSYEMMYIIPSQSSDEEKEAMSEDEVEKWEKEIFNDLGADNYDAYLKSRYGDDAKNYKVVDKGGDDATLKHYNSETFVNPIESSNLILQY